MSWTVRARTADRWVSWDSDTGEWDADATTLAEHTPGELFGPSMLTPTGPVYQPDGDRDPAALLLNAQALIPHAVDVEGDTPTLPELPELPEDAIA